jgi:hypothetical protein
MKKYLGCPENYEVLEQNPLYIKLFQVAPPTRISGGGFTLIVPAQFWPRFIYDEQWRNLTFGKYSKHIFTDKYPEKDFIVMGRKIKPDTGITRLGFIPDDEPFAITKYPHCPAGFSKLIENDDFVKMSCWYMDGTDGAYLTIPAVLWDKFTTDVKWPDLMVIKYGRLQELDYAPPEKLATFTEKERNKTGVVPESEL